ncbi:hypothetical protein BKK49_09580 [Rodentibacter rarus]|uniref:hypothetical protein n=1 Tax=Rodentibacter rarus TaxID=1908260 RepID=UPI000984779D|nr:hypothetical protein [Rodentibacter rarus]OOF38533.1 hypothetical protein BKK49_09580 [Rodentibacter rarus]
MQNKQPFKENKTPFKTQWQFNLFNEEFMRIQLSQGDCLELLSDIQDRAIDLILTDPPYGIDYQSSWVKDKSKRFPKILNDKSHLSTLSSI